MTTVYSRESPSPKYRELERIYREVHERGIPASGIEGATLFWGESLYKHIPRVRDLVRRTGARTVLDYGSGKGALYDARDLVLANGTTAASVKDYWGVDSIRCFDPGVAELAALPPGPFDGVVCTDVLEHVPEEDVPWLLAELFRLADRFVYANIAAYPADKVLPNGWNAHVTVRSPPWWEWQIRSAATGWRGEAYEFRVRQRNSPVVRLARKLFGLNKWTTTTIASDPKREAARLHLAPGGRPRS